MKSDVLNGDMGSDAAAEQIRKLEKINRALMGRVERSMDFSGGAFSLFQTAILLEDKVKARTLDLERTLETLSDAYTRLEDVRDDAEMAKQNLTAAIEAVSEGFALFDVEEKLVMCNAPFRLLMPDIGDELLPGTKFAKIAGVFARSENLVPEASQSRQQWEAARIALFRKPHASFIQQFSGDRWLQISNKKMASGATVIFQTDITDTVRSERVRHERELDEQAKLLRATIDNLPQGICMFSPNMQLKAWNWSFVDLLSLPVKELTPHVNIGRIFKVLRSSNFSVSPRAAKLISEWLENPSAYSLADVEITRSDGVILGISSKSMPDGGIVATFTDVTKERQATLALQEANETLEQRVEERTAELSREIMERRVIETELLHAKEAAEEANKGKTRFLAAASHDLLQPLNASRIFLSLLQETELNSRQSRFAGNADKAFASVEQLLESLLDISRFETRSVETNVSDFALGDILQTLVAEFQPVSFRKGLDLRHVPTSLWVRSDIGLLRRIIQNLLSNAIRYTESGGILLGARRRGDAVFIEVWDTGPGIPEDKRGIIFEEFRRLHISTGTELKAMGLGLAIVDRIAKLLGHGVLLRSAVNKGSCFSVTVLRAQQTELETPMPATAMPRASLPDKRNTVIVIENDLQILEGMVELLEARNFNAIPTVSAEEALEVLETLDHIPSVVLADYHLDDGTGLDAVKRLRRACGKSVPAIMITADHTSTLRAELTKEDISFLGKPLRPSKLFECMASLMN
jgi:two-component system, sensor histidine kinase